MSHILISLSFKSVVSPNILCHEQNFKDKVEFWSCDCIVKETVWNLSEKVDHLVYKYSCVLQGSGIIKMMRHLAKAWQSYKHCTQNDVYGTTRAHGEKNSYPPIFTYFMSYLEYEGI